VLREKHWYSCRGVIGITRDRGLQTICQEGQHLPAVVFLAGPTLMAAKEAPLGSCGPTSVSRMLPFLEAMNRLGVQLVIAKGVSDDVPKTFRRIGLSYGIAVGGAGAFYGTKIKQVLSRKYESLGAEGFFLVEVQDFPFYVCVGGDVDGYFEPIP